MRQATLAKAARSESPAFALASAEQAVREAIKRLQWLDQMGEARAAEHALELRAIASKLAGRRYYLLRRERAE